MLQDENACPQIQPASGKPKAAQKAAKGNGRSIEEMYQKKSQLEHILLRPDTYVGSVEKQTQTMWVFDSATQQMVFRPVTYVSCEKHYTEKQSYYQFLFLGSRVIQNI